MLTTDANLDFSLGEYTFNSSPESYSDDYSSNSPENTAFHSDEDLLQRLSSDFDIPLLLNNGDDDINMLNSFLDKSTDEILSGMSSPHYSSCSEGNQMNDIQTEKYEMNTSDLDDIFLTENSNASSNSLDNSMIKSEGDSNISFIPETEIVNSSNNSQFTSIQNKQKINYLPKKQIGRKMGIPVEPRNFIITNGDDKKLIILNNAKNLMVPAKPQIVCIEKVTNSPVEKLANISPAGNILNNQMSKVIIPSTFMNNKRKISFDTTINIDQPVDPKILKRQQRKIKNRESACLSRKKKRDYLVSLEATVKDLTNENIKLKNENAQLKLKLSQYENDMRPESGPVYVKFKRKIAVCMFLLVLGFNLNVFRFGVHDLGSITETNIPILQNHQGRRLLSISDNETDGLSNITNHIMAYSMCPVAINQSESARLVSELERWIGKPSNMSQKAKINLNLSSNKRNMRGKYLKKRKLFLENSLISSVYTMGHKKNRKYTMNNENELQVFSPNVDQIYSDFFEAINRQEDTFYVVSFSEHHMLLPALHHNRTRRPKMSLIMPTVLQNNLTHSSMISLMQIDCEVQDTRLLNVNNGAIPQHFRKSGNATNEKDNSNGRSSGKAHQKQYRMPFKPYFVNNVTQSNVGEYNFN